MSEQKVFYHSGEDPGMIGAYKKAQDTFKYFWRELSWEYRRIIPGLDMGMAKIAFMQETDDENDPLVEHMWINEVEYDGEMISGVLVNTPNHLTNINNGDRAEIPLLQLSDWLFCQAGKPFGGFTIQYMRSQMDKKNRAAHDEAWGIDFGDYNEILVVSGQKEKPENLVEHPMSRNMGEKIREQLQEAPHHITASDPDGYTLLHREAIAGNLTPIQALLDVGADKQAKTNHGKTALDFARQIGWDHIIEVLEK